MRSLMLVAIAAVVLIVGCGPASDTAAPVPASPFVAPSDVISSIEADAAIPPVPDRATWAKFIDALVAIDPDIVHGKEDKAVDRARNQCSSIKDHPEDQASLVKSTNQRFTSPDHPDGFGTATSAKILTAVRKYLCPTF